MTGRLLYFFFFNLSARNKKVAGDVSGSGSVESVHNNVCVTTEALNECVFTFTGTIRCVLEGKPT